MGFSQWNRIFGDSRLTEALVDRGSHHAHILNFTGEIFRITHALSRNNHYVDMMQRNECSYLLGRRKLSVLG